MRKICFVTGTRAEYGLLRGLMNKVKDSSDTELQIIATNMHLLPEYGETYKEIEKDGFHIDEKVYMPDSSDASTVITSMSVELDGMQKALTKLSPDLIVVLGDRYEIMIVVLVSLIKNIPVAHIHGGEVTEGAFDDAIRHSITKMSYLHFASTEQYRNRIIQMGESPERVFWTGALGVENIKTIPRISKAKLETFLQLSLDIPTILVTYHPVTLGGCIGSVKDLLTVLGEQKNLQIIFTMPNSDPGNKLIREEINVFYKKNSERVRVYNSLGIQRYLSIIPYLQAVVGNSSSGIIEVPSFGIPTLNIGDRQKGRIASDSVCHCGEREQEIREGLNNVLSDSFYNKASHTKNPYYKTGTSDEIFNIIKSYDLKVRKKFYDL